MLLHILFRLCAVQRRCTLCATISVMLPFRHAYRTRICIYAWTPVFIVEGIRGGTLVLAHTERFKAPAYNNLPCRFAGEQAAAVWHRWVSAVVLCQ